VKTRKSASALQPEDILNSMLFLATGYHWDSVLPEMKTLL